MAGLVFGVVYGDRDAEETAVMFETEDQATDWAARVNAEVPWHASYPFARVTHVDFFRRGEDMTTAELQELLAAARSRV